MHRLFIASLLALFAACVQTVGGDHDLVAHAKDPLHLVVLHTNDVHGQVEAREATWLAEEGEEPPLVGGLPRLGGELKRVAGVLRDSGALVLVLDGGDWFQGTPEGLVDDGHAFTELLAALPYDAMVVGNHEFDHGVPHLAGLLEETGVPAVLANVREGLPCECVDMAPANCSCALDATFCRCQLGDRVAWAPPYRIQSLETPVGRLDVALVGLVTPDTPTITHPDARALDFQDPVLEYERVLAELEGQGIELVLPVTHMGVDRDRELARAFGHTELPLIVGGHSHTFLNEGVWEGETLIVQAGCKATVLGRVDLYLDRNTMRVMDHPAPRAQLVELPVAEGVSDAALQAAGDLLIAAGAAEMDVEVGTLAVSVGRSRGVVSGSAGNWITDVMRARLASDVAIQNRGGVRADLTAGELTRRDLFAILPFGNTLVELELTGAELRETVEKALGDTRHSGIEFSGMTVQYTGTWPEGQVTGVRVDGEPLDPAKRYSVATNSFLAGGGDAYFPAAALDRDVMDTGLILRDVLEDALRAGAGDQVDGTNRYEVQQ